MRDYFVMPMNLESDISHRPINPWTHSIIRVVNLDD